ncbi:MAG: tetratricopeptide repeat protein [Anaerolineales bacterium]|nr:tetratricopeptide repeat protein [Anaerolineales bacterium]
MKRTLTPLMIFGIMWLAVVAVSWFFFEGWRESPNGIWTLLGLSAVGVLAFLKGGIDFLKTFNDLTKPDEPKPKDLAPKNQMGNVNQSGGGTNVVVEGGNVTIHESPKPERETHDTIGFIPPVKTEKYIHRGKVEDDVIAHIRTGSAGAIVGVHAPGGLGKTELAKQAAEKLKSEYEVLWVDVGKKEPRQLLGEILGKCGVQLQSTDSDERLKNELRHTYLSKKVFLILDDVREESLTQLADLLPPSPCAALVTSRIKEIGGVKNFALHAMDWDQARQLFETVLGESVVAAELETMKTLAVRCRFNPLAMEIAARRIRQFEGTRKPVARYFEIAQAKFSELKMEGDARWDMDKIFDISYLDLSADDQSKFQILSVFHPTGFSLDAITHLWNSESQSARQILSRFINLSLVIPVDLEDTRLERYRLHDLLDEFATPKLKASGGYNQTKTSLAKWLVDLFNDHYTEDVSTAPHVAVERDNLLNACEWARGEQQADILALLTTKARNWFMVFFTDAWVQWFAWLEASLKLGVSDNGLKANVLQAIGDVQQFRKETDAALESYEEALKLFRQVGAKLGEANVISSQGQLYLPDDLKRANEYLNRAINIYELIGSRYSVPAQIGNYGWKLYRLHEYEKAKPYLLQAADLFEKMGLTDYADRHRNAANQN